jgi:DNA transformation protein
MTTNSFVTFVQDQLHDLGVSPRRMFGGYGLYHQGVFFAIVAGDQLYFKTNEQNRSDYVENGMGPFQPNEKQTLSSYYEVPVEVIEDGEQLAEWARKAIAAQEAEKRSGKGKKSKLNKQANKPGRAPRGTSREPDSD